MIAYILAGGLGTRLRPLTENTPKPMLRLHGKPLLEWLVVQFANGGIRDICMLVNYRSEVIMDYFGDGSQWGVRISYKRDPDNCLGTSHAVKDAVLFMNDNSGSVLVTAADILSTVDIKDLVKTHANRDYNITAFGQKVTIPFCIFEANSDNVITTVKEKPDVIFFSTLMVVKREVIESISKEGSFFLNMVPYIENSGTLYRDDAATVVHISEIKNDLEAAHKLWPDLAVKSV